MTTPSGFGHLSLSKAFPSPGRVAPRRRPDGGRPRNRFRPAVAALEGRALLSTIAVLNTGDSGAGSLRQAILDANESPGADTIDFPPGLTGTITLTGGELAITDDLTIAGPGAGALTVSGGDASRVLDITGTPTVTISGLTIAHGMAGGGAPTLASAGGGILHNGGTLTLDGVVLDSNTALGDTGSTGANDFYTNVGHPGGTGGAGLGGGVYSGGGSVTITECTLSGDIARGGDGGHGGSVSGNGRGGDGGGGGSGQGGGVYGGGGSVAIIDSTFSGDIAQGGGGGHGGSGRSGGNGGNGGAGQGGGVYGGGGSVAITGSTLSGDTAQGGGGGTAQRGLDGGSGGFGGSAGTGQGGGLYAGGGSIAVIVTNSTLSNNSAQAGNRGSDYFFPSGQSADGQGGGLYSDGGSVTVTNSTLSDNAARGTPPIYGHYVAGASQGGGLYSGGSATLNNTIVANSTSGGDVFAGSPLLGSHNLIEDGSGGLADTLAVDPKLGPLAGNGGPAPTMALLPGSPAIDAGSNALAIDAQGNPLAADQRGFARISGATVDIGAFEVQQPTLDPTTLPDATYGTAYGQAITATPTVDAAGPFTFAVTSGTLPAWLTFDPGTGVLAGTPTAAGSLAFTITATASNGYTSSRDYALTIDPRVVTLAGTRVHDGTNTAAASILSVTDLVSGDALTLSGSATLAGAGAGSEAITSVAGLTPGGASAGDYTLTGATGSVTITPAATATAVSSSADPAVPGQSVTFTATVTNTGGTAVTPAGTVQFTVDGANLGSPVPLGASGQAISPPVGFPAGTSHTIGASYVDPAANFVASNTSMSEVVLGRGISVSGTTLYIVGGSTTSDVVSVTPAGARADGSTGLAVVATLDKVSVSRTFAQPFTAIVLAGYAGNETFALAPTLTLPATVTAGNGNDTIQLGGGDNTATLGDGNDSVTAGGGNNTVTVGNGNDVIKLGDGSNVVVEGDGNDTVTAGNGNNLIVGGLGHHTITVGSGTNILIDGSATVTDPGDSLRRILDDWVASPVASNQAAVRSRFTVVDNTKYANTLTAGGGIDWFFYLPPTKSNRKSTDFLN